MSGPLHLNDFPPELLGKIFWHLTVPDILALKLVNRTFRSVVSDQPHLQYKCELAAAGLLDNPDAPGALFDRRTRLHKYRSRFDDLKPINNSNLPLGPTGFRPGYEASGNVYAIYIPRNTLRFWRPPSVSENRPMKTWSLSFPFDPEYWLIYPPSDLLVIADNASTRLHLMSMTTGEPHPLAANQWIEHDLWSTYLHLSIQGLVISIGDHMVSTWIRDRLVLWNWRTGARIIDRKGIRTGSMAFIDDGHLLIEHVLPTDFGVEEIPHLELLNTSATPATPGEVYFVCDPRYRGMRATIIAEVTGPGDSSGILEQDIPFYPDPSQRVLVLYFYQREGYPRKVPRICIVRSETLLRLARLAREQGKNLVEWDTWKKFTVALDADGVPGADTYTQYSVSGSRFMKVATNETKKWANIRVYDLSHWSRQHPDAELDGDRGSDERNVRCRVTQGVLQLPENTGKIRHAGMLQDSIVFFSLHDTHDPWHHQPRGTLDIWSFW